MDGHKAYLKGEFDWIWEMKREVSQQMLHVFYVWMPTECGGGGNSGVSCNEEK